MRLRTFPGFRAWRSPDELSSEDLSETAVDHGRNEFIRQEIVDGQEWGDRSSQVPRASVEARFDGKNFCVYALSFSLCEPVPTSNHLKDVLPSLNLEPLLSNIIFDLGT